MNSASHEGPLYDAADLDDGSTSDRSHSCDFYNQNGCPYDEGHEPPCARQPRPASGRSSSPVIFPPAVGTYVYTPPPTHVVVPLPSGGFIRKRRVLGRLFRLSKEAPDA